MEKIRKKKEEGKAKDFDIDKDGGMKFKGRWCVPSNPKLKERILNEAHYSPSSIHLGWVSYTRI